MVRHSPNSVLSDFIIYIHIHMYIYIYVLYAWMDSIAYAWIAYARMDSIRVDSIGDEPSIIPSVPDAEMLQRRLHYYCYT